MTNPSDSLLPQNWSAGSRLDPRPCPLCMTPVWVHARTGAVVEHLRPRSGPIPLGCPASNHRPSVVERMRDAG